MEELKSKRGGARAGAGRPRSTPSVTIAVRVREEIREKLYRIAEDESKTVAQLITEWVKAHP